MFKRSFLTNPPSYAIVIFFTLFVYFKLSRFGLVGSEFGFFHLLGEKYAGIFGGPVDDIPSYKNLTGFYLPHAILGRVLFFLVDKFAGDKLQFYRFLEIAIIVLINVVFYKMLKVITKSSLIAFLGALLITVNYPGNEIYQQYAYFIERVPIIPIVIIAFIYWVKSFDRGSKKAYFLSITLYVLAIFLGHFAILFSPLFIFYGVFKSISSTDFIGSFGQLIIKFSIYLFVILAVIGFSDVGPFHFKAQGRREESINPVEIFKNGKSMIESVSIQLTSVVIPSKIIKIYADRDGKTFKETFQKFVAPTFLTFIILALFVLKICNRSLRVIFLTSVFSLFGSMLSNLYLDRVNFELEMGASRLYYIPYMFLAIVLAISVYTILTKIKISFWRAAIIFFVAAILLINASSVQESLDYRKVDNAGVLKIVDWTRKNSNLSAYTFVIFPKLMDVNSNMTYFFQMYYGKTMNFLAYDDIKQNLPKLNSGPKIILLEFNENYAKGNAEGVELTSREISKESFKNDSL